MSQTKSIIIVGAMPPTMGGVAIHVERLADRLHQEGWRVIAFDFYTAPGTHSERPYAVFRGRNFRTVGMLLKTAILNGADVIHFHLSSGRHLPVLALLLRLLSSVSRLVLTIHSGSAPKDLGALRTLPAWLARIGIRSAVRIVCVSSEIAEFMGKRFPEVSDHLRIVIPFIAHPKAFREVAREGSPRFLAAGYGTPLYEWMTLIRAFDDAPLGSEVHLAFYNTYAEGYFEEVIEASKRSKTRFINHRDLAPDDFSKLLAATDCFIRPTLTDGDSIAVREALSLGIPVVASDAVTRPHGCVLFKTGDALDLGQAIRRVQAEEFAPPAEAAGCAAPQLLSLYDDLLSSKYPNHLVHASNSSKLRNG
jgi:glycogen(starch) synthase